MEETAKSQTSNTADFSFANYFPGRINERTYNTIQDVANRRVTHDKIIILQGKTGTGKTHLLRALQNEANYEDIIYISSGELQRQAETALADGECALRDFLQKLSDCSLLLIDDIQFAHAGKEFTEAITLSIIKRAHSHGQVVIAGDVLLDDFVQKISGIAPVQHLWLCFPESAALRQIVKYKAAQDGVAEKLNDSLISKIIYDAGFKPYRIGTALNAAKLVGQLGNEALDYGAFAPLLHETVRLAQAGEPEAQFYLADAWSKGVGVPWPDDGQALKWYKESATRGHAVAQYRYACALYRGIGTEPTDTEYEIDSLLYRAAHAGVPDAQFMLAYFKLNYWCQNSETSAYWYRNAAEQNHAFSQYCLARSILEEAGPFSGDKKDDAIMEGLDWLRKAACNGVYVAAYQLAKMFELGLGGIKKDRDEAKKWQAIAKHNAQMYEQSQNEKRAYYSQFGSDNPYGQYLRGVVAFRANQIASKAWFSMAASQGNLGAQNYLDCFFPKASLPIFAESPHTVDYLSSLLKQRDSWDSGFYRSSLFIIEDADIDRIMQKQKGI